MYHSPETDSIYVLTRQYVAIFNAHIMLIVIIVTCALIIGVASTVTSPDEYTSSNTINFDLKNNNPFAGGGVVDGSFIATQVSLIGSKTVMQRVVDGLSEEDFERVKYSIWHDYTLVDSIMGWFQQKLEVLSDWFFPEEATILVDGGGADSGAADGKANFKRPVEYSWMVGAMLYRLQVEPVIGSSNIKLSYVSIDPYVAALIVNGIATQFASYSIERGTQPAERTKTWLDGQLEALRKKLEDAQTRLTNFQQENSIVASEGKLDIEQVALQQLSRQLGAQQQETKRLESRWQQIKASKGESLSTIPQIINDPSIRDIKANIRQLEGQLTEVSGKFGENHPQYKSVIAELSSARSKFNREVRSIASSSEKEAKLAKQTEARLVNALEEQKSLVLRLKNQRDEISVLQREVDSQRETYNAALIQYNQSNLQSLVSQANVSVVDYATPAKSPSGPSLGKNIIASIVLGLILAVGIVFLKEFFNRKIRCKEDVFVSENTHLLGVIG